MNKSEEIKRQRKVADMLISAHSVLRDEYIRYSNILDFIIIFISGWLNALVFTKDENILKLLLPFSLQATITMGIISVSIFILSIFHYKLDFRGIAASHEKSREAYFAIKNQTTYLLNLDREITEIEYENACNNYKMASELSVSIPDKKFLKLKKYYKSKVALSKHLDDNPETIFFIYKIKKIIQDNF